MYNFETRGTYTLDQGISKAPVITLVAAVTYDDLLPIGLLMTSEHTVKSTVRRILISEHLYSCFWR